MTFTQAFSIAFVNVNSVSPRIAVQAKKSVEIPIWLNNSPKPFHLITVSFDDMVLPNRFFTALNPSMISAYLFVFKMLLA